MKNQFFELVRQFQKVFVVIDGLDECKTEPLEMRLEVLDFIVSLTQTNSVWTFVTSRRDEDIKDAFERRSAIQIDSALSNSDIKTFLRDEIIARVEGQSKPKLIIKDVNLKNHILEVLSSRADGMFLWAKLQLDSICKHRHDRDIKKELERLPRGLDETYGRMLERIMQQPPALQELARKALIWTVYGARPLYVNELREALAIEATDTKHKDILSGMYDEETIITSTGNFLEAAMEEEGPEEYYYGLDRLIHPIHYSVVEFFESSAYSKAHLEFSMFFIGPESANAQLAISCLTYLHLDIFEKGPHRNYHSVAISRFTSRFAFYASYFFDEHLKRLHLIPGNVLTKVESFFIRNSETIAAILQIRRFKGNLTYKYRTQFDAFRMPVNATTLVFSTALYDMPEINGLGNDWMQKLLLPKYTLHQASYYGLSTAISHLLLNPGIDINERDESNMTPLHYAVKNGHLDTLKVLLSHSAEVESIIEDRDGKTTALMTACHQAHLAIIEVLLEYKSQVNFHGGAAGNALEVASESGDVAIVKLLLKHEADVDLHGGGSRKALGVASRNGHITVVEMLLQHRADVNLTEKNCETAAAAACSTGHLDIVKLLVKHSARIFEKTMDSTCKRECGTNAVLEFLLYSGAAPTPKVLEEASKCRWLKRCQILLNHGVSITPAAVSNACDYFCKDDGVLDLLLERGGIATSEALERAVGNGWLKRYQKLLDHGVSITPAAISNACCYFCKDSEVLDLLLEKGGTATSKALERAVENGWLKRCQKLLDHGAPITPAVVSNACGARCTDDGLLDLLLERGGVATSKALEMACRYGRYTSCKKLLDAGALITSKALAYAWRDGKSGRTAQLLHTRGEEAGLTAKMLVSAEWKYNCWLSARDCGSFDDSEDEPEEDNKDETDIEIE